MPSFRMTMTLLTRADSRMPMTRTPVAKRAMKIAGRLTLALKRSPVCGHPFATSTVSQRRDVAVVSAGGKWMPKPRKRLTKYPDQPTDTVDAPIAYSSTRSHPMIQATSSPIVA